MKLRNILYIDIDLIDDYVSMIDGYTYDEETIISSRNNEKKEESGMSDISIDSTITSGCKETSKKVAKITDATKLDRVIRYLQSEDELKYYEEIQCNDWDNVRREDFMEILVKPRLTKVSEFGKIAKDLKEIADMIQICTGEKIMDKKSNNVLKGMESLSAIKSKNIFACVFDFENKQFPAIAYLDEKYLKSTKEKLIQHEYCLLCKVQKKVNKGEFIELDNLFEGISAIATNREQRRKMPKNLSNPDEIKDKIKGPAFVVTPIAIYQ